MNQFWTKGTEDKRTEYLNETDLVEIELCGVSAKYLLAIFAMLS
jgi:hypothetical protein